jgi:hypothetical protein
MTIVALEACDIVSAAALDAAAPVVAVAGLAILIVFAVLEMREVPRGRRRL